MSDEPTARQQLEAVVNRAFLALPNGSVSRYWLLDVVLAHPDLVLRALEEAGKVKRRRGLGRADFYAWELAARTTPG
jgi:hypothetical protein